MQVLSIEEVLAAEAKAIHGEERVTLVQLPTPSNQEAHEQRKLLNADDRNRTAIVPEDVDERKKFYRSLNKLNRAALCCSGGGIRSATFCLGVIQALAHYDVTKPPTPSGQAADHKPQASDTAASAGSEATSSAPAKAASKIDAKNSLLGRFHYLSTVSGGGYIGSWLSAWRARADFEAVINDLTGRPRGPDVEPPEISWLRAYSNYLTPKLGITSADTWAAIAICVRNLILNWLVIVPVVCLVLLAFKLIATGSVWIAHGAGNDSLVMGVLIVGIVSLIFAHAFTTLHRPARRRSPAAGASEHEGNVSQACFLWGDLLCAVVAAFAFAIVFSSRSFSQHFGSDWRTLFLIGRVSVTSLRNAVDLICLSNAVDLMWVAALAGAAIYSIGWIAGYLLGWAGYWTHCTATSPPLPSWHDPVDVVAWAASGLVYGALVGLGAGLYALLQPYHPDPQGSPVLVPSNDIRCLLLPIIFAVPWLIMSQLIAEIIFVGLVSYEPNSDSDREWLGRAAGWFAALAIVWAVVAVLVFAGELLVQAADGTIHKYIAASGGIICVISGLATALLGSSSKTPATSASDDRSWTALAYNIALAVAGPIFVAGLIIALSIGLDGALLSGSLIGKLQSTTDTASICPTVNWLLIGSGVVLVVALLASYCVNINRFSLHALYRNRLVRAYLGASRPVRHPDLFTGFDGNDNIRAHKLWPPKAGTGANSNSLFHVINIALNVVSTKRLAWQERKAEPFTVSPLHCGSAYLGFRSSKDYGDSKHIATGNVGIALGTAMAISGAAVSPNMGYNSSPSIALLLTLFNVRLGWWLGNPGKAGNKTYRTEGPNWAIRPLFNEAFGQTTDASPYVYLSDGGHFEDLGLYEMVRRRCRFIVVIDAGCDPKFAFEDLGNAVRKIYIDLGIRITFEGLEALRNHPTKDDGSPEKIKEIPYHAVGLIHYKAADGTDCENGHVLYIKPACHGIEGAGIRSYAAAHPAFPHEDTADQWFTESQFESYRSLGLEITDRILGHEILSPKLTLHQILAGLG